MSRGERLLQQRYGTTKRASSFYENQMVDFLNERMIQFIGEQSMVFIATADDKGNCDSSFRAGIPGFVRVLDNRTLIYPEYRGNGVLASLGNIIENPHIGLMFIDFLEKKVGLHVNGKARIIGNNQLAAELQISRTLLGDIVEKEGSKPERWVVVKVEEAYIHCSKHIPKMKKVDSTIDWGSDDEVAKGGDFFHVKQEKKQPK